MTNFSGGSPEWAESEMRLVKGSCVHPKCTCRGLRLIPCRVVNDSKHREALGYDAILGKPATFVVTSIMRVMGDKIKLLDDDLMYNKCLLMYCLE